MIQGWYQWLEAWVVGNNEPKHERRELKQARRERHRGCDPSRETRAANQIFGLQWLEAYVSARGLGAESGDESLEASTQRFGPQWPEAYALRGWQPKPRPIDLGHPGVCEVKVLCTDRWAGKKQYFSSHHTTEQNTRETHG